MQRMTKQFKAAKEKVPEALLRLEDAIPLVQQVKFAKLYFRVRHSFQ